MNIESRGYEDDESGLALRLARVAPTLLSLIVLAVAGVLAMQALESGAAAGQPRALSQVQFATNSPAPPASPMAPAAPPTIWLIVADSTELADSMLPLAAFTRLKPSVPAEIMIFNLDTPEQPLRGNQLLLTAIQELMLAEVDFYVIDLRMLE